MSELGEVNQEPPTVEKVSVPAPVQEAVTSEPQKPGFFSKIRSIMTFGTSVAKEAGEEPQKLNPFSTEPPEPIQPQNK